MRLCRTNRRERKPQTRQFTVEFDSMNIGYHIFQLKLRTVHVHPTEAQPCNEHSRLSERGQAESPSVSIHWFAGEVPTLCTFVEEQSRCNRNQLMVLANLPPSQTPYNLRVGQLAAVRCQASPTSHYDSHHINLQYHPNGNGWCATDAVAHRLGPPMQRRNFPSTVGNRHWFTYVTCEPCTDWYA